MKCNHQRTRERWVETEDWYHGGTTGEWEHTTEYTTVDLDTHRYKCTQCNEMMYYSGRAREYYEEGIKSEWITGLDN